jgi:hypothetical protein
MNGIFGLTRISFKNCCLTKIKCFSYLPTPQVKLLSQKGETNNILGEGYIKALPVSQSLLIDMNKKYMF